MTNAEAASDTPSFGGNVAFPPGGGKRGRRGFLGAFLLVLPLLCFPGSGRAAEPFSLQLRGDHQFQFAGYYAALWQGYYRDAGLDVEIRSAVTPEKTILRPVQEVAEGRADAGVGAADILVAGSQGARLMVIASIFQESAVRFYARKQSSLQSPADLLRLRVARNVHDPVDAEFQAMLRAEGIDPGRVPPHPHEPGIRALAEGRVDVIPGDSMSAPYDAAQARLKLDRLIPASYGVAFYGDSLFCRAAFVEAKPDTIRRFRDASLKGWQYALECPEEIADRIARDLPRNAPLDDVAAFNRFQIERVRRLTLHPMLELGHINPERWRRMFDNLQESGFVKGRLDLDAFVYAPELQRRAATERLGQVLRWGSAALAVALATSLLWGSRLQRLLQERNRALAERQRSEERYRNLFELNPIETIAVDREGRITGFNRAKRLSGGGQPVLGDVMYRDYAKAHEIDMYGALQEILQTGREKEFLGQPYRNKYLDIRMAPSADGAVITAIDVTQRRRAEEALRESEGRLRFFLDHLAGIAYQVAPGTARPAFFRGAVAEITGHDPEDFLSGRVTWDQCIHPEDRPHVQAVPDRQANREYRIVRKDGEIRWVMDTARHFAAPSGEALIQGVVCDVTFRKEAERKVADILEKLRKALEGIIHVMAATVEVRDPYTAGHQQRVADLARAMGEELGLPPDRVEGLRLAGLIHDIGKIAVPAEILSKPGFLNPLEYELVRSHAAVGYDILKEVDFPWPIAEIVYQHHERLNGSGYPRGLAGGEICLDASILAVADTVEAIASYRPYRSAKGMGAALREIARGKGILYDRNVVEACLALFREKGFSFPRSPIGLPGEKDDEGRPSGRTDKETPGGSSPPA